MNSRPAKSEIASRELESPAVEKNSFSDAQRDAAAPRQHQSARRDETRGNNDPRNKQRQLAVKGGLQGGVGVLDAAAGRGPVRRPARPGLALL